MLRLSTLCIIATSVIHINQEPVYKPTLCNIFVCDTQACRITVNEYDVDAIECCGQEVSNPVGYLEAPGSILCPLPETFYP
jgi:hypothetical protein